MKGKRKMLWLFAALCLVLCMGGKAEAKEKGFQDVDGKVFYYKNGEKQKDWVQIKGKWYYFNKKGVMQTGWVTWKKDKYYLKKNGQMVTGLKTIQGKTYYFTKNGDMVTGWKKVKGKWRYFRKKRGVMAVNCTIGGRSINEEGVWVPKKTVVIDPGHSGVVAAGTEPLGPGSSQQKAKDASGTQGTTTGVPEYRLTLEVSKKLKKELEKRGYLVLMTRTDHDTAISCKERAMVANKAKADAYVRIHANGSTSPGAHGAMTICTTPGSPFVSHMYKKNRKLSEDILDAYVERTGAAREYIWETDSMSGNNWSQVPTTILEMGYMTNPQEDVNMQSSAYQKKMVKGIADGIDRFFEE